MADACRTAMVWMFSLWLGWEHFNGLQVPHLPVTFTRCRMCCK